LAMGQAANGAEWLSGANPAWWLALLPAVAAFWMIVAGRSAAAGVRLDGLAFAALLLGTCAFGKRFSQLHLRLPPIPGLGTIPLYVTDATMGALLIAAAARQTEGLRAALSSASPWFRAGFWTYLLAGAWALFRGLREHPPMLALRDSATVYYALFSLIAMEQLRDARNIRIVAAAASAGGICGAMQAYYNFCSGTSFLVTSTGTYRYLSGAEALACAFVFVGAFLFIVAASSGIRVLPAAAMLAASELFVCVFLVQHRSLWLAVASGAAVAVLLAWRGGILFPANRTAKLAAAAAALILPFLASGFLGPEIERQTAARAWSMLELKDGFLPAGATASPRDADAGFGDPNITWRIALWSEYLRRWMLTPIFGEGFGGRFAFTFRGIEYPAHQHNHPHNSFVWVLNRTGIVGAAGLLAMTLAAWLMGLCRIHLISDASRRLSVIAALACNAVVGVMACFNVVLEGPHLGIFYWISLGAAIGLLGGAGDQAHAAGPVSSGGGDGGTGRSIPATAPAAGPASGPG
ncbi:MAG: O-antigen ligase family protein, partial [Planctomycetota bacterium]|nr:O-antigen ligase family protein [Planctomycetota bacterium]